MQKILVLLPKHLPSSCYWPSNDELDKGSCTKPKKSGILLLDQSKITAIRCKNYDHVMILCFAGWLSAAVRDGRLLIVICGHSFNCTHLLVMNFNELLVSPPLYASHVMKFERECS